MLAYIVVGRLIFHGSLMPKARKQRMGPNYSRMEKPPKADDRT